MATCLDIITYALRLAKVIGAGETPDGSESTDGLVCLQSMYDHWRTGGMFGSLEDVYLEEDDVAEEGKRYYVPSGITLTDATSEYVDAFAVTRQPRDLAMYESLTSAGTQAAKLYDRTEWVDLLGLTLNSDAPLAGRNTMGLAACLATYAGFADMFGAQPGPNVYTLASQFLGNVMGKPGSTQDKIAPEYF